LSVWVARWQEQPPAASPQRFVAAQLSLQDALLLHPRAPLPPQLQPEASTRSPELEAEQLEVQAEAAARSSAALAAPVRERAVLLRPVPVQQA
jgi:hypothetical protein